MTSAFNIKNWMIETALPFWSTTGFDSRNGVFFERMGEDALPDYTAPMRVRVQFRQIYTLSHAAVLGWLPGGGALALNAWNSIAHLFYKPDGAPGFVHILSPDGTILDARRDSYDHAFAILALAWLARATGDRQIFALVDEVLAFVDTRLTDPRGALYEGNPRALPRRQNPQMHWFEAMLALHVAIDRPDALMRAARFRTFFEDVLFDPATATLGEYFAEDWSRLPDATGDSVEPGHQAEWTWLLRTHERLAGLPSGHHASRLLDTALASADPASGLLVDEVDRMMRVRRGTRRSWLQTELCKAWIAECEAGRPGARAAAISALDVLHERHLCQPFHAGWIDMLDEQLAPVSGPVPASILYHVFVAAVEADRVLGQI